MTSDTNFPCRPRIKVWRAHSFHDTCFPVRYQDTSLKTLYLCVVHYDLIMQAVLVEWFQRMWDSKGVQPARCGTVQRWSLSSSLDTVRSKAFEKLHLPLH